MLYDVTRMRGLEAVRREFLSNVAHELRTPVTSVAGYAETLLAGGIDAETSKEFVSTIHRNARRTAGMVSDLLVLDKLGGRAAAVGERGPVDDHLNRGGLYNLSLQMSREHIIRAIFEGVAYNVRWLCTYVERFMKRPFPWLNFIGGGANSNVWCQIFADVLNRPIRQVDNPI